jgi:hypothetical protein
MYCTLYRSTIQTRTRTGDLIYGGGKASFENNNAGKKHPAKKPDRNGRGEARTMSSPAGVALCDAMIRGFLKLILGDVE